MVYKLSATLTGHSSDVRAVASPSPNLIVSASRDSTAVVWTRPDEASPFKPVATYKASDVFVNTIAYIPPSPEAPQGDHHGTHRSSHHADLDHDALLGYVATGSQNGIINVYALGNGSGDPVYTLLGHTTNVCSLHVTPNGMILSGSWDQSARVWKAYQPLYELRGHAASVLAVLALNDEEYLTASADKTIKLWKQHKQIRTFTGHSDVVRGLGLVPDIGFASCSNDGDVRVWTPAGDLIFALSGHTSFVYSVTVLPSGDIVSSGEDRTVRVWKDGECAQIIVHPAISVWAVASMPNGDIVSGSSDYRVRVFSAVQERWASEADLKIFEDTVASHSVPAQAAGPVDANKLPGEEALSTPGKKEGENKLIRTTTGTVDVYTWTGGSWTKVGEMTDGVGSGPLQKKTYNGKEWDYVFEVDVADGAPKLMLPYNANENPYAAAQRFLAQNDLPPSYIDQVVQFIEKQTAGVNIGGGEEFVDPYTGASRYRSGGSAPAANGTSRMSDPFTGASRYQAPATPSNYTSPGAFSDPFTGASRYAPPGTSVPPPPAPTVSTSQLGILPVKQALPFRQCNVSAMRLKLLQLNDTLKGDVSMAIICLTRPEVQVLERIFTFLETASSQLVVPKAKASGLRWNDVDVVLQIIGRWPESHVFPLIDLLRLLVYFCPLPASAPPNANEQILETLLTACHWNEYSATAGGVPSSKTKETNVLLALRALGNVFQVGGPDAVYGGGDWTGLLLTKLAKASFEKLNKAQRVAFSTLLLNYSCAALAAGAEAGTPHQELVVRVLRQETNDSETAYRALAAFGNNVYSLKRRDPAVWSVVEPVLNLFKEERFRVLAAEIKTLLKA